MSEHNLIILVSQQKALARRNRNVRNATILLGIFLGLLASFAWLALAPSDGVRPEIKFIAGVAGGCLLGWFVLSTHEGTLFPQRAACPSCGHDWEIKEGDHVPLEEKMLTWDRCPGCGSLMDETLLAEQKSAQPSTKHQ